MSNINCGTVYEMQKKVAKNFKPYNEAELKDKTEEIGWWMYNNITDWFMLLCKERSDYTIIHIEDDPFKKPVAPDLHSEKMAKEVIETLQNRGDIVDIDYISDSGAYEFWVNDGEEVYMFMLFDCKSFIIEI